MSSHMNPTALINIIKGARDVAELTHIVSAHHKGFNASHDSTVAHTCARLARGHDTKAAQTLCARAASRWLSKDGSSFGRGARGAANVMHSLAKARVEDAGIVRDIAKECDSQEILTHRRLPTVSGRSRH